jgi:tetratricopeptide (TPR) repeat protein
MRVKRRASGALALLAASVVAGSARADGDPADSPLKRPERLTVGVADDLLGQLSADGKTLYYVSNRNTTNQVFAQSVADGRSHQLFDDDADVTWPRVSPDGRQLLYISYRDQAAGRLCLRRLPDGGERRCFDDPMTAALQAEWIDGSRIALVARQSIQGELRVLEVTVGGTFTARPVLEKSISSPTISPDGQWLLYVPVARTTASVGPAFAAQAAEALEVVRLGSSSPPTPMALDLPGQTGQPAFARDGRSVYVVQFFVDTNHDGVVDASDHGVVFRAPLSFTGGVPVAGAPEQLTEISWSCQYPAPFDDRLIVTCSPEASLDIYSLPLDGAVPASATPSMLASAFASATTHSEEELLASRRLASETTAAGRRSAMLALALVHLEADEFRAAEYYARSLHKVHDATTRGIGAPLDLLVEQRRASRRREQGRMMEGFGADARKRLEKLHAEAAESPLARDLIHIVRSEIADSIGDKGEARAELEAVKVDETTPEPIVRAYYLAADALYRELDDPEALVSVCRRLASSGGLMPDEQLRYARAAVRAMVRGKGRGEARERLAREQSAARPGEAELAFALTLEGVLLDVRDAHPPQEVVDRLLAAYAGEARPGRRSALVAEVVLRAGAVGADELLLALAARAIVEVKPGTRERPRAEGLYRKTMTGRAYLRASQRRYDEAIADFDAVARETRSFEAVVGAIDMRLKKGDSPQAVEATYDAPGTAPALAHFAKAYVTARGLPKLEGVAHAAAAKRAIALVQSSWSELKGERIAQALFGALLHEEYLMTGDLAAAERANVHYLVALELMGRNVRFRAMITGELGMLHADVGNYRIALGYLEDRDRLPYSDNSEGLDVHLSEAEALLHVGRDVDAALAAEKAIAVIERNPGLAQYRLLALDWAALANLSAGRFERALALYDEEVPLLDAAAGPGALRNRIVARVARAAAAVGAGQPAIALKDLDTIGARLADPAVKELLRWPHSTADHVARTYRRIAAGLRARACRRLGRFDDEATALRERLQILTEQLGETKRVEIERAQMLELAELAINASERHDAAEVTAWLGKALVVGDDLTARAGKRGREELDVLWLAAELSVSMASPLVTGLSARIDAASEELRARRDPSQRSYQRWLEIYGPLVRPTATP